jgi:hypothetical protein
MGVVANGVLPLLLRRREPLPRVLMDEMTFEDLPPAGVSTESAISSGTRITRVGQETTDDE